MKTTKILRLFATMWLAWLVGGQPIAAQTWWGTSAPNDVLYVALASSADGTKLAAAASGFTWSVYTSTNSGGTWREALTNVGFGCIASSADGLKLAGGQYDAPTNSIYTSADGGDTWRQTSAPDLLWTYITCSTKGATLAALGMSNELVLIYVSRDAGATWTTTAPVTNWNGLACSADGTRLVASTAGNGIFYTSTDAGATWSPQTNVPNLW